MAHGYFNHFGGAKLEVYSAGIETHGVNPRAIAIMKDDGVDISSHTSNNVNEYLDIDFDFIAKDALLWSMPISALCFNTFAAIKATTYEPSKINWFTTKPPCA